MQFLKAPLIRRNHDALIFHSLSSVFFLFFLIQIYSAYQRLYAPASFDNPIFFVALLLAACVITSVMFVTYVLREGYKEWVSGKAFN